MNKKIRIGLIIICVFLGLVAAVAGIYYLMPGASDFGTFLKMRDMQINALEKFEGQERAEAEAFDGYSMELPFLHAFMFKTRELSLFLKSWSTDKIETASINQLEIGKETNDFFDYTFIVRPRPEFNVPFFHGDALKALPGVTSALYMDFYSFEHTMDAELFFEDETDKLERALELARPYWKHEGFGELTPHLDPYKSRWRLEMVEPEKGSEEEKREYFDTVHQCYALYLEAYLNALEKSIVLTDPERIEANKSEMKRFISILYEHDIAVKMGKMIFPEEDFDNYFLHAFWGVGKL